MPSRAWGLGGIAACVALSSALLGGCGGGAAPEGAASAPVSGGDSDIARIHKARCGTCHQRVEPGERTRPVLEDALSRHRKRVHLTEEQWAKMVDYLAAP
jgi:hypothetical protein